MAELLELVDVVKHFRVRSGRLGTAQEVVKAVDGVSLGLSRGQTLGLVGESGCGKSTLGRIAMALDTPTSGEVRFEGRSLVNDPPPGFRRRIQMVFQDPYSSLNPRKSIGSIVGEPLAIHRTGTRAERRQRVAELLELVGLLPEHSKRYPHEFSGGQRQRAAVARALALNPDVVVLDEPVSALDVSIQAQVVNLLADLQQRLELTYLFISHDLSVVYSLCDRVAVMYLGRLVEQAGREALYRRPLHPYTRTLLSAVPQPDPDRPSKPPSFQGDERTSQALAGCTFAPRCPQADSACRESRPEWIEAEPGHFVACHKTE